MDSNEIKVGLRTVSGSTFRPDETEVVAVLSWIQLSNKEQRSWLQICYWLKSEDFAKQLFVATRGQRHRHVLPMDVFCATHYHTLTDMIAAYEASHARAAS